MNKIAAVPKPTNTYDKLNTPAVKPVKSLKPPVPQMVTAKHVNPVKPTYKIASLQKEAEVLGTKPLPPLDPAKQQQQMIEQENEMKMQGLTPAQYRRQLTKSTTGIAAQNRDTVPVT